MCADDHKVIDDASNLWTCTVERLTAIKAEHEMQCAGGVEPDDAVAERLIAATQVVVAGSVVMNSNQMRGARCAQHREQPGTAKRCRSGGNESPAAFARPRGRNPIRAFLKNARALGAVNSKNRTMRTQKAADAALAASE
jgi:hypothetical protein